MKTTTVAMILMSVMCFVKGKRDTEMFGRGPVRKFGFNHHIWVLFHIQFNCLLCQIISGLASPPAQAQGHRLSRIV